ncbi:MAG: response regulator [Pseudomonadota bacterium]
MSAACVLVIEDDPFIRDTLQELLELEGFSVAAAENGRAGLNLLTPEAPPRLILLDLMMPVMDGWEFLEIIHREPRDYRAAIPIVVVSAAANVAQGLKEQHGCEVMPKPVDVDRLLKLVHTHCGPLGG